jgi:hypothetical protein
MGWTSDTVERLISEYSERKVCGISQIHFINYNQKRMVPENSSGNCVVLRHLKAPPSHPGRKTIYCCDL